MRRLTKSSREKIIFGVCGGLAAHFDVDPVFVRLAFVVLAFGGFGIVLYLVMAIIMPREASTATGSQAVADNLRTMGQEAAEAGQRIADVVREKTAPARATPPSPQPPPTPARAPAGRAWNTIALILIAAGVVLLLANLGIFGLFPGRVVWPLLLIGVGLAIVFSRTARRA